jgi:hypothetical protein
MEDPRPVRLVKESTVTVKQYSLTGEMLKYLLFKHLTKEVGIVIEDSTDVELTLDEASIDNDEFILTLEERNEKIF